jgi:hypothetical protein
LGTGPSGPSPSLTRPGATNSAAQSKLEPLSAERCLVQFTARRRAQKSGSRHVPLEVERAVRERDGDQCTFTDAEGRRCQERRFITLEHRIPFAFGGPPTVENLCCLCASHNAFTARQVFGEAFIAEKRAQRAGRAEPSAPEAPAKPDLLAKVQLALCKMGFRERDVQKALTHLGREPDQ